MDNSSPTGDVQETMRGKSEGSKATQFQPGQSGNPGGRTEGSRNFATLYKDALVKLAGLNKITPDELENEMIANAVKQARGGNYHFYRDILDRLHGKATQRIIGDIDVTNRAKVDDAVVKQLTEQINELYRRTGGGGNGRETSAVGPQT